MKKNLSITAGILLFSANVAIGAEPTFSDVEDGMLKMFVDGDKSSYTQVPDAIRTKFTLINLNGIKNSKPGSVVNFNLFDDASFELSTSNVNNIDQNTMLWSSVDANARIQLANIVTNGDRVTGTFYGGDKVYELRPLQKGLHQIIEFSAESFPDEGLPVIPKVAATNEAIDLDEKTNISNSVDVMVLYTNEAALKYENIEERIRTAVQQANLIYSTQNAKLNLVFTAPVNYKETGNALKDLQTLQNPADGMMDDVHSLRKAHKADLVSLWTANAAGTCGQSFALPKASVAYAPYGVNVVDTSCATNALSFAHVVGSNLGLGLDDKAGKQTGVSKTSLAATDEANQRRSLMATRKACSPYCQRVPVLSGTDKAFNSGKNSNVATLKTTAPIVANYMQSSMDLVQYHPQDAMFEDMTNSVDIDHPDIQQYLEKDEPYIKRWRIISVDRNKLPTAHPSVSTLKDRKSVVFNLFPDATVVGDAPEVTFRSSQRASVSSKIQGEEKGSIHLVLTGDQVRGAILSENGTYEIKPLGGGLHQVIEVDQSKFPVLEADTLSADEEAPADSGGATGTDGVASTSDNGLPQVDILVAYTADTEAVEPDMTAYAQLAVDTSNAVYQNSGINMHLNLVGTHRVNYTETGNSSDDLAYLRLRSDGHMDEIHDVRDSLGADLVALFVETISYCGRGYIMTSTSAAFDYLAFSVTRRNCAVSNLSFTHELGHNLGMQHDMHVAPVDGAYPYSHGYIPPGYGWRTVMSYSTLCSDNNASCPRIGYHSNPDNTYNGSAMGDAATANGALSINNIVAKTQAYRDVPSSDLVEVRMVGTHNAWSVTDDNGRMAKVDGEDVWEGTVTLAAGALEYKFIGDSDWTKDFGDNNESSSLPQVGNAQSGEGNIAIQITQAGEYTARLNDLTGDYSLYLSNPDNGGNNGGGGTNTGENFQRTVIFIYGTTSPGQDMFIRGGIDHGYGNNNDGRNCLTSNFECAIDIRHQNLKNGTTAPWKDNDNFLDWYGAEMSQGSGAEGTPLDWTTNSWPADWGTKKTVANDGFGEEPLNTFGPHYWMLDVEMNCDKTVDGWFEVKSYISNGPGWEADASQSGTPYSSGNHFGKCGQLNVFSRGSSEASITPLP